MWERLGIGHVGLSLRKCEEVGLDVAARRVRDAGLRVSNVVECGWCELADTATWPAYRDRLLAAVDAMRAVGAPVLVLTTGPAGPLEWDDAALALGEVLDPVIAAANDGVGARRDREHEPDATRSLVRDDACATPSTSPSSSA